MVYRRWMRLVSTVPDVPTPQCCCGPNTRPNTAGFAGPCKSQETRGP